MGLQDTYKIEEIIDGHSNNVAFVDINLYKDGEEPVAFLSD